MFVALISVNLLLNRHPTTKLHVGQLLLSLLQLSILYEAFINDLLKFCRQSCEDTYLPVHCNGSEGFAVRTESDSSSPRLVLDKLVKVCVNLAFPRSSFG